MLIPFLHLQESHAQHLKFLNMVPLTSKASATVRQHNTHATMDTIWMEMNTEPVNMMARGQGKPLLAKVRLFNNVPYLC